MILHIVKVDFVIIEGRSLKVVNGEHNGCTAEMVGIDQGKFTASVKLSSVSYILLSSLCSGVLNI